MAINPLSMFRKVFRKRPSVPIDTIAALGNSSFNKEELSKIKELGIIINRMDGMVNSISQVNYDRSRIYRDVDNAIWHWMPSGALELYADFSTTFNTMQNATVWVTSENSEYARKGNKLLDELSIEEKVFDWAWTTGAYGDLFVQVQGMSGTGVHAVDDSRHPIEVSRVDFGGTLLGFYETPVGLISNVVNKDLISPWQFVHFRLLGAKKRRYRAANPAFQNFVTSNLLSSDIRQLSSKYGTSLLLNGMLPYKRVRMIEDSLLLARLTRGITKYIYKYKVDADNIDAVNELITQLSNKVKRATALDLTSDTNNFDSRSDNLNAMEDIFIPVLGDAKNDLVIDKIGEGVDIRWIADYDKALNVAAAALRISLPLLGAFSEQASGALGADTVEQLDIRFARSARRLQRSVRVGVKRILQIHFAYLGMDPDPDLFDVEMSETSTAEEAKLKESLQTSVDTISSFVDMCDAIDPRINKLEVADYLTKKFLKLDDFSLLDYVNYDKDVLPENTKIGVHKILTDVTEQLLKAAGKESTRSEVEEITGTLAPLRSDLSGDLTGALPIAGPRILKKGIISESMWNEKYKEVTVEAPSEDYKGEGQTPSVLRKKRGGKEALKEIIRSTIQTED